MNIAKTEKDIKNIISEKDHCFIGDGRKYRG